MKVGIINVTGYAGAELARLIYGHPETKLVEVTGRSAVSKKLGDVFPHLSDINLTIKSDLSDSLDIVFSALPHTASGEAILPIIQNGIKVIDISADFRLKTPSEYTKWYQSQHPAPELLKKSVYGLTELYKLKLKNANIVANPGCYPTGALLSLAPLVQKKLIGPDIIIDSKSGISGSGRGLSLNTHYSETNENVEAYSLDGHRHLPEIIQEVHEMNTSVDPKITFVPHLVPMTRGILTTCYLWPETHQTNSSINNQLKLLDLFTDFYQNDPFVKIVATPPKTKQTLGTNNCIIHPTIDQNTGRIIVISCIDNLIKGAAGQAVQNMNIMSDFPEIIGLEALAIYP